MSERDRLIELIEQGDKAFADKYTGKVMSHIDDIYEFIADYLFSNGVKVPPVQIGQELWDIHYNRPRKWEVVYLGYNGKEWFINIYWHKDRHNFKTMQITYPFIGKMWYFTKEEAEQALQAQRAVSLVDGHIEE